MSKLDCIVRGCRFKASTWGSLLVHVGYNHHDRLRDMPPEPAATPSVEKCTQVYTPGPWMVRAIPFEPPACIVAQETQEVLATIPLDKKGMFNLEQQANASLMAAGPELLTALKKLWAYVDSELLPAFDRESQQEIRVEIGRIAEAAVKKAEGR